MSKKSENLSDLSKKDRNKRHSSPFINVVKGVFFAVILKSARDRPGTGNNARRIGILFKSNFCRNYNGILC